MKNIEVYPKYLTTTTKGLLKLLSACDKTFAFEALNYLEKYKCPLRFKDHYKPKLPGV